MLRWILSAVAFWALAHVCPAQARYAGTGPGSLVTVGGTVSGFQTDYDHRRMGGYGGYVDANLTWRLGLEGEMRFLREYRQMHSSTYLIGPRISFGTGRLNPYAKVLVGLGHFTYPYDLFHGSYFVESVGGGVDLRLGRRLRWRVADFEYQRWPQFTFGAISPYGVSTGISYVVLRSGSRMTQ
ncbi:MAG TPA: hypothetical protein VGC07_05235 [Granulicella sp.]